MGFRLLGKSIMLAMRSRRRFIAFTAMYTVLMLWLSMNLKEYLNNDSPGSINMLVYSVLATVVLSIIYAWIIVNYRKQEIATMKCIGYTNSNIRTIMLGEIIWVTLVAFLIVAEVLIHQTAATTYYQNQNLTAADSTYYDLTTPILQIKPVLTTLGIFLVSQIVGILIMYSKILKLRPIVALRVLK